MGKNDVTDTAIQDLGTLFRAGAVGGLSDGQLLGRFVERREQAVFEAILLRHGPMVWGVCRRVLRDHHDAEDALQATFLVLARRSASIAHREKLGNWLYGVAYQTARKARAKRTKRRGREGQVPDMPEPTVKPDELRDDLAESLDRELSRLPEKYRLPIVLCDLEGRSHSDAANQLGWPIGTVSGRLSRARVMLAGRLSRRGVTLAVGTLAALLARESASAHVPTPLIHSTAQAASRFAADAASATGIVSAEVAALTGEVMMPMVLKKYAAIVFSAVGALMLVAGLAWAASRDPDPAKGPAVGNEATSFRRESVRADELLDHMGLNIYKFVAKIPKGKRFRVVWRQVNTPGGDRVLYEFPFQKETDDPTTILVSFLRMDQKLGGVLLSDEKEARFKLDCSGCDPGGIATFVPLPMAGRVVMQKTLVVHKTDERKGLQGLPKVDGMRLLTLLASQPDKPLPIPLPGDAALGELVIEFEE